MKRQRTAVEQNEHALKRMRAALAKERDPQERANLKMQIERTQNELRGRKRSGER